MKARLATLALLAAACFAPPPKTPGAELVEAASGFADQLRWARTEELVRYLPPEARRKFLDTHDKEREVIELTEWEIVRAELGKEPNQGQVRVKFTWHAKQDWVVQHTVVEQTWTRKGDRWFLLRARHLSGEQNPLFAAPPADKP